MTPAQERRERERRGENSMFPEQQQLELGWHLDKKVPLSLIFAMLVQAAMVIWAIADIKKDVEVLKAAYMEQTRRDERQDKSSADAVGLVREDIKEVKVMISRLIDRADRTSDRVAK